MPFLKYGDEFLPRYVKRYNLSKDAIALHHIAMLECAAAANDGALDTRMLQSIWGTLGIRNNRPKIIRELMAAGLWVKLKSGSYQLDWTHQKTSEQVARSDAAVQKRQAAAQERASRCASGDHSKCKRCKALRAQDGDTGNLADWLDIDTQGSRVYVRLKTARYREYQTLVADGSWSKQSHAAQLENLVDRAERWLADEVDGARAITDHSTDGGPLRLPRLVEVDDPDYAAQQLRASLDFLVDDDQATVTADT